MVELNVRQQRLGEAELLTADGEIDMTTRMKLSTKLNDLVTDGEGAVILDLGGIRFIDSTGLGILLNGLRRLTRQQRPLVLVCPEDCEVRRVIKVTGLTDTFRVRNTLEEALAAAEQLPPGEEGPYATRR